MGKKIIIVGNGGSGKSTLSVKLGGLLDIPVTHLDFITFSKTGKPLPLEQMRENLHVVLTNDEWIIEGWSYQTTMQERIDNADTIIYLDYPLWFCYWNAFKRQVKSTFRRDPFSPLSLSLWSKTSIIAKAIWRVHKIHVPELRNILSTVEGKYLYCFRSRRELRKQLKVWEGSLRAVNPQ